jgi:hypothetical protein
MRVRLLANGAEMRLEVPPGRSTRARRCVWLCAGFLLFFALGRERSGGALAARFRSFSTVVAATAQHPKREILRASGQIADAGLLERVQTKRSCVGFIGLCCSSRMHGLQSVEEL